MEAMIAFLSFLFNHWLGISASLCIATILYLWGIAPYRRSTIVAAVGDLPGPTPLPFVGHLLDLIMHKGHVHRQFDEYYRKFGRLFCFMLFGKPSVSVNDPEMLKEIFVKEFQSFHDRPSFFSLPDPFDSMLANASGETWHRIRSTLSPMFSTHRLKVMIPLINRSCDVLNNKLQQVADSNKTIDIYEYHQGLTMEALLATFFGIQSNAQMDYDDPAFKAARQSFKVGKLQMILVSLLMLLPGRSLVMKYFPSVFVGHMQSMADLTEKIIEAKKNKQTSVNKDVLDMMLNCTQELPSNTSKWLTEKELIAQCFMFLMAGYETTSSTLALASHSIAVNPYIQEKLQKEIDGVWIDDEQPPSYDVIQSLPYLDMVICETLRLYPPAFVLTRECNKDCRIKGLQFKKGTNVIVLPYSIHHDPDLYPDPENFNPERFSTEAKQSRDPYTYFLFGHGPRNCIGMRFALLELKLVLVRILKKFSFAVAPETEIPPELEFKSTLGPKNGVKLSIRSRDDRDL